MAPQVLVVSGLGETAWSVLFGHRKGAFTGAESNHSGVFSMAHGSSLILEDVAELPMSVQPMLLRAVEHGFFRPLGDSKEMQSDVRILSTTNMSLEQEIHRRRFRPDLYQRLSVLKISLPPLRDHLEDLELYVPHFLEKAATSRRAPRRVNAGGMKVLAGHSWPRNIRELEHFLFRASVETKGDEIDPEEFERLLEEDLVLSRPVRRRQPSRTLSRGMIRRALEEARGNKREAARRLGVSPGTLYTLLRKHDLSDLGD
jgi:DNA-binding NtrC family response regulator